MRARRTEAIRLAVGGCLCAAWVTALVALGGAEHGRAAASDGPPHDVALDGGPREGGSRSERTHDAPDWPTNIDIGPDGSVYLSMATDVGDEAGVSVYGPDLAYVGGWGTEGRTHDVAAGPTGRHVYVDGLREDRALVSRFRVAGEHVGSWPAGTSVAGLAAAPNGDVLVLAAIGDGGAAMNVVAYGSTGRKLDHWAAPEQSLSIAVDGIGHVYVGHGSGPAGAITHYSMSGTRMGVLQLTMKPVAIDVGPDERLYVAGTYGADRGDVTIWERDGAFVSGIPVDAVPVAIAVGPAPEANIYLVVRGADAGSYQVRTYDREGRVLDALDDIRGVTGLPRPPTATPGGRETPATPWWPSPSPRPRTPTASGTPGTPEAPTTPSTPEPWTRTTRATPATAGTPGGTEMATETATEAAAPTPQGTSESAATLFVPSASR